MSIFPLLSFTPLQPIDVHEGFLSMARSTRIGAELFATIRSIFKTLKYLTDRFSSAPRLLEKEL